MHTPYKRILCIALIVSAILLVPLVLTIRDGGVEGVGWNWTLGDFVLMGTLLFMTGFAIDTALRRLSNALHRGIAIISIMLVFLAVWAELAVDAVSKLLGLILG